MVSISRKLVATSPSVLMPSPTHSRRARNTTVCRSSRGTKRSHGMSAFTRAPRKKHLAQSRSPLTSSALIFPARVGVLTNTLTQGTQLHPFRRSSRGTKRSYRMSAGYKETCTIITNTVHAINNSSWAASIHSRPLHPKTPYP